MDQESQQKGQRSKQTLMATQEGKALIEALVKLFTNTMWLGENRFRNGYLD